MRRSTSSRLDQPTPPGRALPPHEGSSTILAADNISKAFSGVVVLRDVSFDLRRGEVHALMGENGAGKSTLVKIFSGVHADYQGKIFIDGAETRFFDVRDAERAGIAMIHQELNLVPELNVAENIFLGREPLIGGLLIDRRRMLKAARTLLARLGIAIDPEMRVGRLRVGEQQLVEIAKALSLEARILIMDEPTSALSTTECQALFRVVRQLAAAGVAIIYITHRLDEVTELADRVTVLRDGRHVLTAPMRDTSREAVIKAMVGRELTESGRESAAGDRPVMLAVQGLSLDLPTPRGWKRALGDVSFELRRGEILGIGGLLGSGRTEILESIFGVDRGLRGGRIFVEGVETAIASPADAHRHGIALITEDRKGNGLHLRSSIKDNIALASLGMMSRFGLRAFDAETALARRMVDTLGIRCAGLEQPVASLSGGNQQKVVIGKWLATTPRILLLDEPTRGIDVGAKRDIYELIFNLAAQGLGIVVVTSELPELLLLADRILVMCEGRMTGMLTRAEATQEAVMRLAAPGARDASGATGKAAA
ncbi:monosaccharide ABC transporter ATP-binding protein, CUT2 family [Rhizobiales bacterium GAS113]|nr:monosaccharide ABC transporter ATP-binding protein, CUT2 family [Rhizobiales bacterium GAS113]